MSDRDARMDQFLTQRLDAYIQETADLCAQPSVSARKEGTRQCAVLVAALLEKHGFDVHSFETPGDPVIVGRAKGRSERTLLFYNHYDVQPPEPLELWTTPPFEPTLRDGALYARGAKDDKGELVARLAAVDAARDANGGELPCGVTFVVEGEEEIGSPHIAQFVLDHLDLLRCNGAVWEEGGVAPDDRSYNMIGCRGILSVELSVEAAARDAHSGGAHLIPSAAWQLTWALASLKGQDERIRIPGFYEDALPPSPQILEHLATLPSYEEEERAMLGLDQYLLGRTGDEVRRAVYEPTCNIQGITTGYQGEGSKTVIPSQAFAKLDFRLVPDQDPVDIETKLRARLDQQGFADVAITTHGMMWPAASALDNGLVRLTEQTAQEIYGVPALTIPLNGGSSPIYAFQKPLGGIPVVRAGVGYINSSTHAPNEHVRLNDFLRAARQMARMVDRFADIPD